MEENRKSDLITISARKKKTGMNGQFSIRPDSYVPRGVVQNRGRSVKEDRGKYRWDENEMKEKKQL